MFEAADIREWRGHDVIDPDRHKIGELEAVYVDTVTDLPSFATVRVGLPTRHRLVFVPSTRQPSALDTSRSATTRNRSGKPSRSAPTESCQRVTKRRSSRTTA